MSNNFKILLVLVLISFSLGFYILFSLNKIDIQNYNVSESVPKIHNLKKTEKSSLNYSSDLKKYLEEANLMIKNSDNVSEDDITELRKKILNLKSPDQKYKKTHLNLILALDKLRDYTNSNNQDDYDKSLSFLEIANSEY